MKLKILFAILFVSVFSLNAQNTENKKMLIIYYSWSGNTREIANQIQSVAKADVLEIVPQTAYPTNYQKCVDQARKEVHDGFHPVLKAENNDFDIDKYDIIFVGTPNWCSTMAPPVASFLTLKNFSGKTIVPFVTHGGGGTADCVADMKKICTKSTFLNAFSVYGSSVKSAKDDVYNWLKNIKVINW